MAKKRKLNSNNPKYNNSIEIELERTKEVVYYATIRRSINVETNRKAKVTAVWY